MKKQYYLKLFVITCIVLMTIPAVAQDNNGAGSGEVNYLFWAEIGLLVVVFLVMPIYSCFAAKSNPEKTKLKGLNLPEGSVRSMLALIAVGSFVNFLIFGSSMPSEEFDKVLAAFGTLTGTIIGFYFGHRGTDSGNKKES